MPVSYQKRQSLPRGVESVDRLLDAPPLQEYASDDARNFAGTLSQPEKTLWEPFYTRWPSYDQSVKSDKVARTQLARLSPQDQARLKPLVAKFLEFVGRERTAYDRQMEPQQRHVIPANEGEDRELRELDSLRRELFATSQHPPQGDPKWERYRVLNKQLGDKARAAALGKKSDWRSAIRQPNPNLLDYANESHGLTDDGEPSYAEHGIDGEDHDEDDRDWDCSVCGGPVVPMGKLGKRLHGRCRDCGADQSLATESMTAEGLVDELLEARFELMDQLIALNSGERLTFSTYEIYYDAEQARGDDGRPVPGAYVGSFEVNNISRQTSKSLTRKVFRHGPDPSSKMMVAKQVEQYVSELYFTYAATYR